MTTSGTLETASGVTNARDSLDQLLAFTPLEIDRFRWQPVAGCPGVYEKQLWRLGDYVHALIRYDSGASSVGKPLLAGHEPAIIRRPAIVAAPDTTQMRSSRTRTPRSCSPSCRGGIVVEGNGNASTGLLPQVPWIANSKTLIYWG